MKIYLNETSYELAEGTMLDTFVATLNVPMQGIAIAIDGEVIPRKQWAETLLTDGVSLMMIHAVSGG